MNYFEKYKNLHDAVWQQTLNAGDNLKKLRYWLRHYDHLWSLCFKHNHSKKYERQEG